MSNVTPEDRIRSSIQAGSVYYFREDTFSSTVRHFFIVLNYNPTTDNVLILVCSSSKLESVKRRRRDEAPQTLIEIRQSEYAGFTVDSIVDCNTIIPKTIGELGARLDRGNLRFKAVMRSEIVEKLREGVLASRLVAEEHKNQLKCGN